MQEDRTSVLIVEDDERTAAFLADNLAADGFRTACAADAGEGWRALEVRRPDVMLLDLMLGDGLSGLDLLDRVRSSDGLASRVDPELPVIVLTGRSGEADRVRGFARGADDYVLKPTTSLLRLASQLSGRGFTPGHGSSMPSRSNVVWPA
jgi:DNA-binding response OmpR family regulator